MGSGRCVVFLAGRDGEKVLLLARFSGSPVTESLDTTVLMKAVAPLCGGDGGGTTMVAQGGGVDVNGIPRLLDAVRTMRAGYGDVCRVSGTPRADGEAPGFPSAGRGGSETVR